jgi:hypothetical protein
MNDSAINAKLARLPLRRVITELSQIAKTVDALSARDVEPGRIVSFAEAMFAPGVMDRVRPLIVSGQMFPISSLACMVLAQHALVHCTDSSRPVSPERLKRTLGEMLLAVADRLDDAPLTRETTTVEMCGWGCTTRSTTSPGGTTSPNRCSSMCSH